MSEEIKKYDEEINLIYHKDPTGLIYWWEYNENGHLIHVKNSFGREAWYEYNKKGEQTTAHYKNLYGEENWYIYDEDGNQIDMTKQKLKEREEKEFLSRTPASRFELMDI